MMASSKKSPDTALDVDADLVITFRATKQTSVSKLQIREDAQKAERQYSRLIETLTRGGLCAVGRRGEYLGHLLVFVSCPTHRVQKLIKRERHADFISGLPIKPLLDDVSEVPLSPADRLRLVYTYITCIPADGGLGVTPGSPDWDLVESIFALHNRPFNDSWIHTWSPREIASVELIRIREQFGDAVALYFAFLSSYTKALVFPAVLGLVFSLLSAYTSGTPTFYAYEYSPLYSFLLFLWALTFVEWWRAHEHVLALRFGTRGADRVEKNRAHYVPGLSWWRRELRVLASVPVILVFAVILTALLTGIFVLEAFVTQLYTGPGYKYASFTPTLLFVLVVPKFLSLYQLLAQKLTSWENHAHHSTHAASLTLKSFALAAVVAYLGLALTAFVYVPFGEEVMRAVQRWLFTETARLNAVADTVTGLSAGNGTTTNTTITTMSNAAASFWDMDIAHARLRLNPGRLREQMFAYTVTNQVMDTLTEVGLPFVLRFAQSLREQYFPSKSSSRSGNTKVPSIHTPSIGAFLHTSISTSTSINSPRKKRVVFEDEQEKGGIAERVFLDSVREEAALPAYELFDDYSEMVTQFGYVVLWSAIWPLAGAMALLNNFLELRSDAFKITVHHRRPVPQRTDTIGPWLDALTFLTWLGALTNAALVYLFHPQKGYVASAAAAVNFTRATEVEMRTRMCAAAGSFLGDVATCRVEGGGSVAAGPGSLEQRGDLLLTALLVALVASHGAILMRAVVRHVVRRVVWSGCEEVKVWEREEREVKEKFLSGVMGVEGMVGTEVEGEQSMREVKVRDGSERKSGNGNGKVPVGEDSHGDNGGYLSVGVDFWDNDEGLEEIMRISKEA